MHCPTCLSYVPYGAKYCRNCGEAIPAETQNEAYNKTLWGKLSHLENWYKTLALKKVTDSWIFRILVLLIILLIGVVNVIKNGTQLKITAGEAYDVQYNTVLEEYYILTDADEVYLNLYIPNHAESLLLTGYDESGKVIEQRTLTVKAYTDGTALRVRKDDYAYLTLDSMQGENSLSKLKFLVLTQP